MGEVRPRKTIFILFYLWDVEIWIGPGGICNDWVIFSKKSMNILFYSRPEKIMFFDQIQAVVLPRSLQIRLFPVSYQHLLFSTGFGSNSLRDVDRSRARETSQLRLSVPNIELNGRVERTHS